MSVYSSRLQTHHCREVTAVSAWRTLSHHIHSQGEKEIKTCILDAQVALSTSIQAWAQNWALVSVTFMLGVLSSYEAIKTISTHTPKEG